MYKETESKIQNTLTEAKTDKEGNVLWYRIRPANGFKLHENSLDEAILDENGIETGAVKTGFTESYITAGANYDFDKNERQIYAVEVEDGEDDS